VAQKVSCLSAAHGKETSNGDGSLPLRQVRLEGLGLLRDRQSNPNLWYTRHNVSKLRQLALSLYNAGDSRMLFRNGYVANVYAHADRPIPVLAR
jgi:hypothetical protein